MAELLFKRGLQADLDKITTPQDGTFYLTTDTGRMYAGITLPGTTTPKMVELNQSITPVNTVDDLPKSNVAAGQFYYVKGTNDANAANTHKGNILAFYDGSKWVQINPDTDHYLKGSTTATTVTAATNGATVTTTVEDTKNGSLALHKVTGNFSIEGNENITVTVDGSTNKIKLAVAPGALYGLATEAITRPQDSKTEVAVNLIKNPDTDNTTAGSVSLLSGANTKIERDADGKVVIDTKYEVGIKEFKITNNATKGLDLSISNHYGAPFTKNLNIPVELTGKDGTTTVNIVNGKLTLPVYTAEKTEAQIKAAIEDSVRTVDAMHYRGIVSSSSDVNALLTTNKLHNGDVYKVATKISSGISNLKDADDASIAITGVDAGDLIIFTGAENAAGYLSAPFTAKVIPSGDDQVVKFTYDTANNTIKSADTMDAANANGLHLVGGTHVNIASVEETNGLNKIMKTTFTHADVERKDTTGASVTVQYDIVTNPAASKNATFTVVDGVTTDDQGHITSINTKSVTVADSHNDVKTVRNVVANVTNDSTAVSVTTGVSTSDRPTVFKEGSFNIKGIGNVVARADGSNVKVSLEWGSF